MNTTYKNIIDYINKLNNSNNQENSAELISKLEIDIGLLCERAKELELENKELKEGHTFLTISEAVNFMRISRKKLDEIMRKKEIPVIKYTSKLVLLELKDIEKYIESKKISQPTTGGE